MKNKGKGVGQGEEDLLVFSGTFVFREISFDVYHSYNKTKSAKYASRTAQGRYYGDSK